MAEITSEKVDLDGLNPSYVAVNSGGDKFENNGNKVLHVKNGGGSSINVAITAQKACDQGTLHNGGGAVPAGEDRFFGPLNPYFYNDGDGDVNFSCSAITSVTAAVLEVEDA